MSAHSFFFNKKLIFKKTSFISDILSFRWWFRWWWFGMCCISKYENSHIAGPSGQIPSVFVVEIKYSKSASFHSICDNNYFYNILTDLSLSQKPIFCLYNNFSDTNSIKINSIWSDTLHKTYTECPVKKHSKFMAHFSLYKARNTLLVSFDRKRLSASFDESSITAVFRKNWFKQFTYSAI